MSENSQPLIPQSQTTIAETPPLDEKKQSQPSRLLSTANTEQIIQIPSNNVSITEPMDQQQRLQLYNSLFGQEKSKGCEKTGLQSTSSLNYSLYTFLHLSDSNWVLALIDIESFDIFQEKYGESKAYNKLNQIGTVVKNFSDNIPSKLKGFKYVDSNINNNEIVDSEDDCKHDIFALLMYCYPKLKIGEKYIKKLIKKIQQQTNEQVFVGIAKMNEWESFVEWKTRALKNLKNAKNNNSTLTAELSGIKNNNDKNNKKNRAFFSDIGVKYVNPKKNNEQEEKQEQHGRTGVINKKMGNKEEFDSKMKEIANNEDYEWIVAVMSIDDYDGFLFSNNNNKDAVKEKIDKMEGEMYHLFDICGNGSSGNEMQYFGYKLVRAGEFGLILYDSKDTSKCYVPAHEIIESLKEEISMKCEFTVSIGCSRLIEDDLGFGDDWYQRVVDNLKAAKNNGKNEICFGVNVNDNDSKTNNKSGGREFESKFNDMNSEDDAIEKKTFQEIDVWFLMFCKFFFLSFLFFLISFM